MMRRTKSAIAFAVAVALTLVSGGSASAAEPYFNINGVSLRCLDARYEELYRNGTGIQLWDCYGAGQFNQFWKFGYPAGTYFLQIINRADGRCLDADWHGLGSNGTRVQLWDCYGAGSLNQLWYRDYTSSSDPRVFQLRNAANNRCLDADYFGFGANGTRVQLWDCYGRASYNQYWRIGVTI
jgi:hypothetical protein